MAKLTSEQKARHAFNERLRRARNPERHAAACQKWREANGEKVREQKRLYVQRWRAENPDLNRVTRRRQKMRVITLSEAAQSALVVRANVAIPSTLPREIRTELLGMLIEGVYSGRFPRLLTSA